jgi:hypothetical protein
VKKFLSCLFIAIVIMATGCLSKTDRLGQFQYVHREPYAGVPVRVIPIVIDKNFGEYDKVSIDDAINQWNYVLNGYIKLNVVNSNFDMEINEIKQQKMLNGWLVLKIDSNNTIIPTSKTPNYRVLGFCNQVAGNHMYLVRDRLKNEDVFGVSLHEIGHLLGSEHNNDKLMYEHYTALGYQCIDYMAIKAVAEYQNLPIERMNYCIP